MIGIIILSSGKLVASRHSYIIVHTDIEAGLREPNVSRQKD